VGEGRGLMSPVFPPGSAPDGISKEKMGAQRGSKVAL